MHSSNRNLGSDSGLSDRELRLRELVDVPTRSRRMYPRARLDGLEPAALQILVALVLRDADNAGALAKRLCLERSTVSHAIGALRERGLVEEQVVDGDRRRRNLHVSQDGSRLVREFAEHE